MCLVSEVVGGLIEGYTTREWRRWSVRVFGTSFGNRKVFYKKGLSYYIFFMYGVSNLNEIT